MNCAELDLSGDECSRERSLASPACRSHGAWLHPSELAGPLVVSPSSSWVSPELDWALIN